MSISIPPTLWIINLNTLTFPPPVILPSENAVKTEYPGFTNKDEHFKVEDGS